MKLSRMSLLVLLGVVVATFFSGCSNKRVKKSDLSKGSLSSQPRSEGKPKIVALEKEHDFGEVKQGAILEHVFRIRNQGDQPLVVERASGS